MLVFVERAGVLAIARGRCYRIGRRVVLGDNRRTPRTDRCLHRPARRLGSVIRNSFAAAMSQRGQRSLWGRDGDSSVVSRHGMEISAELITDGTAHDSGSNRGSLGSGDAHGIQMLFTFQTRSLRTGHATGLAAQHPRTPVGGGHDALHMQQKASCVASRPEAPFGAELTSALDWPFCGARRPSRASGGRRPADREQSASRCTPAPPGTRRTSPGTAAQHPASHRPAPRHRPSTYDKNRERGSGELREHEQARVKPPDSDTDWPGTAPGRRR